MVTSNTLLLHHSAWRESLVVGAYLVFVIFCLFIFIFYFEIFILFIQFMNYLSIVRREWEIENRLFIALNNSLLLLDYWSKKLIIYTIEGYWIRLDWVWWNNNTFYWFIGYRKQYFNWWWYRRNCEYWEEC